MKKLILLTLALAFILPCSADVNGFKIKDTDSKTIMGLFLCFSGESSKYEDDNVVAQIYNQSLWIKNKTNRTIYLDLSQGFAYYNDETFPFYVPVKDKKGNVVTEDQFYTIPPMSTEMICELTRPILGTYSVYTSGDNVHIVNKNTEKFMGTVDDMRIELESNHLLNSSSRHFEEDDSFISLKAAISYSFDKKNYSDPVSLMVSSWVSDIVIAKSYVNIPPKQKKEKTLAAKQVNPAKVCTAGCSPFDYDEEESPVIGCEIKINTNKGEFNLFPFTIEKVSTNFLRLLASVYTAGLIDPVAQKTQSRGWVSEWLCDDVDFSKIKDDGKGTVTIGNKGREIVIYNGY